MAGDLLDFVSIAKHLVKLVNRMADHNNDRQSASLQRQN